MLRSIIAVIKSAFETAPVPRRAVIVGQSCKTCRNFQDFSDTEPPEEVNGYCLAPFHSTWKSEHQEYGGHWTHTESWCDLWEDMEVADTARLLRENGEMGAGVEIAVKAKK